MMWGKILDQSKRLRELDGRMPENLGDCVEEVAMQKKKSKMKVSGQKWLFKTWVAKLGTASLQLEEF